MEHSMKICGKCKEEFPKTKDYFFKRTIKNVLANGEHKEYQSFKSQCKKCFSKDGDKRRVAKRCKELNCDIKDYEKRRWEEYSKKRIRHPSINHLPESIRRTLRKWMDNGYAFTTHEQYKKDCSLNISVYRRKYSYDKTKMVDEKLKSRSGIINLTDAYIALTLGFKVSEVPKEIIETKRLYLQLKRELGETKFKTK